MGIVSSVVSLHYAFCKSVDTFLEDFIIVLSMHRDNISSSNEWKSNVKKMLAEALDLHSTSTRYD